MSLECEGLGTTCSLDGCGTYDFLPTTCSHCRGSFCTEHAGREKHHCCVSEAVPIESSMDAQAGTTNDFLVCATCGDKNMFVSMCSVCSEPACVAHRFEHMHGNSAENQKRVQHPGAPSRREPVMALGPLPPGARGVEMLALFVDAANGIKWCHALLGAGGSAGRVCDDATQHWPSTSTGVDQLPQYLECFVLRTKSVERSIFHRGNVGAISMHQLLALTHVPKAELVQSFAAPKDVVAVVLFRCKDPILSASPDIEQCWTVLAAGMDKDIELRRRLTRRAWSFAIASNEAPPAAGPASASGACSPLDATTTPVDSGATSIDKVPQYDDATVGAPLCTVALNAASVRFATTKATPRGLAESKSKPHRFVAILVARPTATTPQSHNAFVMAFDANWSRGKLMDRVLAESRSMVGEQQLAMQSPASSAASRWALICLPSMEWLCCQGDATMARLCDAIADRSALLLVLIPHGVVFGTTIASVQRQMEQPYDTAKVRLVQLKECSVM